MSEDEKKKKYNKKRQEEWSQKYSSTDRQKKKWFKRKRCVSEREINKEDRMNGGEWKKKSKGITKRKWMIK